MEVDVWHASSAVGALIGAALLLHSARLSAWLSIPFAYFFLRMVYSATMLPSNAQTQFLHFQMLSSARLALAVLSVAVVVRCERVVEAVILLNLTVLPLCVLFKWGSPYAGDSHDTLVIAVFLPYLFHRTWRLVLVPLCLAAILSIRGGATAQLLLVIYAAILASRVYSKKYSLAVIAIVATAVGFFMQLGAKDLSIAANRSSLWIPYLHFWGKAANMWLGLGPASFEGISAALGPAISPDYGRRMWMHGDWMQCLFEFGLLGVVAASIVYFRTLWQIKRMGNIFLAWIGIGVGMLVYSPLQFWTVQVLAGLIIMRGEHEKNISKPSKTHGGGPHEGAGNTECFQ